MSWSGEIEDPVYSQEATGLDPLMSSHASGSQRAFELLLLGSRSNLRTIQIPMPQIIAANILGIRCLPPEPYSRAP